MSASPSLISSATFASQTIDETLETPRTEEIESSALRRGTDTDDIETIAQLKIADEKTTTIIVQEPAKWITLNVGGRIFATTLSTLTNKEPNSMLARMFGQDSMLAPSSTDASGAYLIDRSSQYFEPILNFLRHGQLIREDGISLYGILEEAKFFGIDGLIPHLEHLISITHPIDEAPLTRRDVVTALIQTSNASVLRFQGINLAGADLSKLDLRHINFKFACLSRCNLKMANLSHCCLERADLSYARMDGAQLMSVKGSCANMERATLQGCDFEDLSGTMQTLLEGVNLKGACLENSNLAAVNLRVANLKDANLKNCNLRRAILAGADLEVNVVFCLALFLF